MKMKNCGALVVLVVVFVALVAMPFGAAAQSKNGAVISMQEGQKNLGTVAHKSKTTLWFVYTNRGGVPLVIHEVETTCGCTKPKFARRPTLPQQKDSISVVFEAKDKGAFYKKIVVKSNAAGGNVELYLRGIVQ